MQASSAISFRLPPASISAAASSGSPFSTFRFLLGRCFHDLASLPHHFLPPLFFTNFNLFQFWILTTKPLFLPFPLNCYCLTATLTADISRFRFICFHQYVLPDFSCILSSFWYSYLLFVSFHPSLIRSHSCSSGAYLKMSLSIVRLASIFFRPYQFDFRLLGLLFLPF